MKIIFSLSEFVPVSSTKNKNRNLQKNYVQ